MDKEESNLSNVSMKGRITRRKFVKGSAALATLAAGSGLFGVSAFEVLQPMRAQAAGQNNWTLQAQALGQDEWIYSACNMCGGQTGIVAHVVDGSVVKIEPNSFNPVGVHNISTDFEVEKVRGGRMCSKGNSGIKSLYDPDRIKTPMKRVGARGEGQWLPITWDEAINEISVKLNDIKAKYGAESLVWFGEDHSLDTDLQSELCAAYGTPNYHNHANLCDVARKASYKLTMGDERPIGDFAHAKYILLFGWNPLDATKWAHLPAIIMDGIEKNGAKMVVIDPVFSKTASKAHEWIPIRPGTDGALALAMGNVIVNEKLYDSEFVNTWTVGFNEYAEFVKDKTPEWAEKVTSVPADTIRRLARELATTKPAAIDVWSGPGQQANGTEGGRAIVMLAGLLGQVDKPGTMMNPDRKGGKKRANLADWPKITAKRLDGRGEKYPFAHSSGIYVETRDAMLSGQPYQARAAVFVMQNFVMSVPNAQKNIDAIKKMEFVVAVDTHISETADLADIIIPGTNYLERYDITSNWVTFQSLSLRQPVVKSWINGLTETEFFMRLATKMGLKGFDMPYEQYLSDKIKAGIGITLDELKLLPGAVWIGKGTTYEKFKSKVTVPDGATTDPTTGVVKDKANAVIGVNIGGTVMKGFNTPSRKFEFYSNQMKTKGLNPLPDYMPTEDRPNAEYPYYFVSWKPQEHTHTRTQNNVWLVEMLGSNPIWINTKTAEKLGLAEGDDSYIESLTGKIKSKVHVTNEVHPEVVAFPRGFGHWRLGNIAKGKGSHDGWILPGKAERISGMARNKEAAVRIIKVVS
ncbi:MAG: molybdopterin-dependent oxidoreductase [Thaumarchaeota archaeon]|nr:molybdopterin-dependent oxidoreductase [Nitrososphaerota archaeon]